VEGVVYGDEAALGRFKTWLSDGPRGAQVFALDWQPSQEKPADGFSIRKL
jgi:acylphosphatase